LYLLVGPVFASLLSPLHLASRLAVSELIGAVLLAQSLHPADLARASPALQTARAR